MIKKQGYKQQLPSTAGAAAPCIHPPPAWTEPPHLCNEHSSPAPGTLPSEDTNCPWLNTPCWVEGRELIQLQILLLLHPELSFFWKVIFLEQDGKGAESKTSTQGGSDPDWVGPRAIPAQLFAARASGTEPREGEALTPSAS